MLVSSVVFWIEILSYPKIVS